MLTAQRPRLEIRTGYRYVKRAIDVVGALVLLVLFAPLLLLIVLLIRLDSRGPAVYRQQRVGRDGRNFTILKFRSMRTDAPCISTEEMQRAGINPVTRMGRILRATSLDELPQLVNILKGEMSFIGPRPALPSQTDVNTRRDALGVHAATPGITGLAQVMGRDDLDTDTKVGYDYDYCTRLSLRQDIVILWLTFLAVTTARGNK